MKKEKVRQKTKQGNKKKKRIMLFSIRNKIIFCFLVPMAFMAWIGFSAYEKAAEGMSSQFMESTTQTIEMAREYIDMGCSFVESEGFNYAYDKELSRYYLGIMEPLEQNELLMKTKSNMLSSQTSNAYIQNIHILTDEVVPMLTSVTSVTTGSVLDDHRAEVSTGRRSVKTWIDNHSALDTFLEMKQEDYILAYEVLSELNNACVVIDIKPDVIRSFLQEINLGEGSILGFVTESGRELWRENLAENGSSVIPEGSIVFADKDFYQEVVQALRPAEDAVETEEIEKQLSGVKPVTYGEKDYYFVYSYSEKLSATVCALVPTELVIGQAEEIRTLTTTLILVAMVIVLVVGIFIVAGIQNNMKRISRKFGEVAKGDLTVSVRAKGHDEFRGLADSATNMIKNTKQLVHKVASATEQLELSSDAVNTASGEISDFSGDITRAIADINEGMNRQSEHALECVNKTDTLSNEIQEVSRVVEKVERLVDETEGMINQGMEIVQLLGGRAEQTTQITVQVSDSIRSLRSETELINSFVETITEISEQTNLLSLNASIEAARAGEAGRGFSVVAEEIRKLADDSAKAAGEIRGNVEHISQQTGKSVNEAEKAQQMVELQSQSVEEVVTVFKQMQECMGLLINGLKSIVECTEKADSERFATVQAVKNISDIIEETAGSTETVKEVAEKLLDSVNNLNRTSDSLGNNMEGLKSEIAVFKI